MSFCTKCGSPLRQGVRFCPKCRAPVAAMPVAAQPAVAPTASTDNSPQDKWAHAGVGVIVGLIVSFLLPAVYANIAGANAAPLSTVAIAVVSFAASFVTAFVIAKSARLAHRSR